MENKLLKDNILTQEIDKLSAFIGNTPLFPITKVFNKKGVQIYAKMEWQQFSNSVKARAAFNIIKNAIEEGRIDQQRGLIDASSGNTAVAYASIGAALGIPVTLCVPENASEQKKSALKAVGANIIYTSRYGTTDEAQERALNLFNENPDKYYYTDQYNNSNNWKAHYNGTANEIWNQTNGNVTHFVAGLGTTGTFVGTSRKLKELNPAIRTISLQPETALHGLEGWKHLESAKVPGIYDINVADNNYFVETFEVYELMKEVAQKEGLLLSPSSAANLLGAMQVANKLDSGVVVTVFPDHGSNYQEVLKEIF
jgi:S-sulfo-L-cysteine synthase (O-acetyl-L-serine-dependent)